MNYSRMLHDFVENDLPGTEEETLFHALAGDEELRFELKYLMTLRGAVESDTEAGAVSLSATGAIFHRLGYALPVAGEAAIAGAGGAGLFARIFNGRVGGYLLSGLAGLLVGSLALMTLDDRTVYAGTPEQTSASSDLAAFGPSMLRPFGIDAASIGFRQNGVTDRTNGLASLAGRDLDRSTNSRSRSGIASTSFSQRTDAQRQSRATTSRTTTSTSSRLTPVASNANRTAEDRTVTVPPSTPSADGIVANSADPTQIIDNNGLDAAEQESNVADTDPAYTRRTIESNEPTTLRLDRLDPKQETTMRRTDGADLTPITIGDQRTSRSKTTRTLAVTLRGSVEPTRLVDRTLPVAEENAFRPSNDPVIGLLMPVSDELAFVMEGGEETYLMTFRDIRPDGSMTVHEIEPSVLWGTAGIRYSPFGEASFSPFLQVSAGGSGSGLVERGMLGFEWSPGGIFDITGGVEVSAVQYQFAGALYSTPRLGLSYGMRLNLFGGENE